ncbi:MAG: hypothetical protein ACJA08_002389 [Cyclobacteriaceae bacterium]|jgi:hypothetical protein
MEENEKKGFKELLGELIVPKVERIAALLLFAALLMKYFGASGYAQILGISLTTLGITTYLYAFLIKSNGLLETILIKLGHIAGSVTLVGVMFASLQLPGSETMIPIGLVALSIAILLMIYGLLYQKTNISKPVLVRYSIIFLLGVLSFF